jgi:hypothetical protein
MSEVAAMAPPRLFDGKITLAILITVVVQAAAALLWVGAAAQRIDALESALAAQASVAERLARLETEMAASRAVLVRIESRLDRDGGGRP